MIGWVRGRRVVTWGFVTGPALRVWDPWWSVVPAQDVQCRWLFPGSGVLRFVTAGSAQHDQALRSVRNTGALRTVIDGVGWSGLR